jgi:hypothetical protein
VFIMAVSQIAPARLLLVVLGEVGVCPWLEQKVGIGTWEESPPQTGVLVVV